MPSFTRKAIESSFLKLLQDRPLSQITVKDIVEDCNVNRNSFYYHFQDIPSLLGEVIQEMIDQMIDEIPEDFTLEEGTGIILRELVANKKAIRHIWSSSHRDFYEMQLMRYCDYMIRRYVEKNPYDLSAEGEEEELMISFLKFSTFGQIICWLNDGMTFDIEDYGRRICRLVESRREGPAPEKGQPKEA